MGCYAIGHVSLFVADRAHRPPLDKAGEWNRTYRVSGQINKSSGYLYVSETRGNLDKDNNDKP